MGDVKVVVGQGLLKLIVNLNPLSLVLDGSLIVEVTVNVWLVSWSEVSLVEIVTILPDTEIQA